MVSLVDVVSYIVSYMVWCHGLIWCLVLYRMWFGVIVCYGVLYCIICGVVSLVDVVSYIVSVCNASGQ